MNKRQQAYLTALFTADQGLEAEHQQQGAQGHWSSTPARVWRRIDVNSYYSPVARSLRTDGVYDSGAGATLAALADRGLIESGWIDGVLSAWMTRAGRTAARAGLGYGPRWAKPKWALSEGMWRALVKVAETGTVGLPIDKLWSSAYLHLVENQPVRGNRGYLRVVKTHVRYTPTASWHNPNPPAVAIEEKRRLHLTEEGRAHYIERLVEYREMYDEIEAPEVELGCDSSSSPSHGSG
ncbi:hypothetical protein [Streptomyces sp. NPDC052179]|uniref:hypothetical protein n=1 Tax=Streptomyces sp. NPDC052179 TaxID=3155680 RepID=UPI00341C8950